MLILKFSPSSYLHRKRDICYDLSLSVFPEIFPCSCVSPEMLVVNNREQPEPPEAKEENLLCEGQRGLTEPKIRQVGALSAR